MTHSVVSMLPYPIRGLGAGRVVGFVVGFVSGVVGCGVARGAGVFAGDELVSYLPMTFSTSIGTTSNNSIQQPTVMVSCDTQRNDSLDC